MVAALSAFWSYSRDDDECTDGHIVKLSKQIGREFKLINGNPLEIFIDRESIEWGEEWAKRIDDSIHNTTLFIPIITPSYLRSSACRYEFLTFWSKSRSAGLVDLMLPIVYTEMGMEDGSGDEILTIVSSLQCQFWFDIRLEDESSSIYKRAIHKLAERIKKISEMMESVPEMVPVDRDPDGERGGGPDSDDEDGNDVPGTLDQIANLEDQTVVWQESIEAMTIALESLASIMNASQPDLERATQASKMSQRLASLRRIAGRLMSPCSDFYGAAEGYRDSVVSMDAAFGAVINDMKMSTSMDPQEVSGLADTIGGMYESVNLALMEARPLVDVLEGMSALSRDMRKPGKLIVSGITMISDTQTIIKNWIDSLRGIE
ncbi:TIR domain-containing protein [Nocardia sp. NPDC051756]|uniref:TIR domain-containing protein n=1 Tax=Nocardia sp. NPDC051756 TaxID=3154751 RepID=UPI0034496D95